MTREEAIEVLQRGLDILGEYADSDLGEAHRMAISALSENKAEKHEICKGCLEPCIMYEPDMRACKHKVTEKGGE